jgi:hypothetical protein
MLEPIELPPPEDQTEEMRALASDMQRRFVMALVIQGDDNHGRAAAAAGYAKPGQYNQEGYRLFHRKDIQAALHAEAAQRLNGAKMLGVSMLVAIVKNMEHKNHFQAVQALLNRVGFHETTEHKVSVDDHRKTDKEIVARIELLCQQMGLDSQQLLGNVAKLLPAPIEAPIDAGFTVVDDDLSDILR